MDTWPEDFQLPVVATVDRLYDGVAETTLNVNATAMCGDSVAFTKVIGQVKVTVTDGDKSAVCKSINDPHMTSFDGW